MARPGLQKHPKFRRLVHTLGVPVPHVIGYLECAWEVCYECGDPLLGDAVDVELAAQWPGEPGKLVAALEACGSSGRSGFIDRRPDGLYEIHDLWDHAPDYVRKRRMREKQRQEKGGRLRETADSDRSAADSDSQTAEDGSHLGQNGQTRAPSPSPSPSLNTNDQQKIARAGTKFAKPTLAEVTAYCRERGNSVDPQRWIDHYESNGWKVGKNAMKDWKAAVRTWERNGTNGTTSANTRCMPLTPEEVEEYNRGYNSR